MRALRTGRGMVGRRMSLILDHINGIADDNRLENLQIVCPNCAATLDTHCGRAIAAPSRTARACAAAPVFARRAHVSSTARANAGCVGRERAAAAGRAGGSSGRPTSDLRAEVEALGWSGVGRRYGVSDNAVRKWMRAYERELRGAGRVEAMRRVRGVRVLSGRCRLVRRPPRLALFMRMLTLAAAVAALLVPAAPALAGDPDDAAVAGAGRHALYRLFGDPGHGDQRVRRAGARRRGRRGVRDRQHPRRGVRAGGRRDWDRAGLLGLADLLHRRSGRGAQHRRDLAVGERVRREGRAGDVDRGDHRHAGRRPRRADDGRATAARDGAARRESRGADAGGAWRGRGRREAADGQRAQHVALDRAHDRPRRRPGSRCWPCRRGRSGRSRRRRCGRARRSRSGTPTATCARARWARSPTSTATACGSSATNWRATAVARCCCRTRTSTGSSTTR